MSDTQDRKLHPDLHPLLLQFQELCGQPLETVWRVYEEQCLDKIILQFASLTVIIEAEPDDDTIKFHVTSKQQPTEEWCQASGSEPWIGVIGKPFGWGWLTINHLDALDGILMSFSGNTPQVLLTVVGSSIKESIVLPVALRELQEK